MTITAPAPPRPAPAASGDGRVGGRRLALLGVALIVLLAAGAVAIFQSFSGVFSSYAVLHIELPASSTAVALNAPVEYRNVTVGAVADQGHFLPGGLVEITLHMQRSMLRVIPVGVEASETPVSFFGDAYIVLQPPAHPGTATIQPGATIPPLSTGQTASLQSTLGDLDKLLIGLHPAQLDAALTALAGALQGQGISLGHNLVAGNTYFSKMLPLWPTVVADLKLLVPVTKQFAASTRDLLVILHNQTVTGVTIDTQSSTLRQAISGGSIAAGEISSLLAAIQQPYAILTADSGPFLQDISQNPVEISQLLSGLDAWAKTWTAAESSGPYLDLTADVVVANPADLGLAVLGGPEITTYLAGGLGRGFVNPTTYSSAGTIPSATGTAAAHELASAFASAPAEVLPEPAQSQAVERIVHALVGRSTPTGSTAVSTLLLSPLLTNMVNGR